MRVSHSKGVSTALATIAIILVLVLGMSWMAYMTVINAAQQARHAAAAETAALRAKELVRVYIWLDPARQPGGSYRNLTRISFVNTWSGETTINSLLIVWRDGRYEERPVSIRLGAGEDRTFLPSQLGLEGLDNYQAALERIKYIQVHTSLGNDFVSLWGRPDKPALYVTGTTRTDTYTVTRTSTTVTGTTTTHTTTTTSYTTTWTTTTTGPPPPGTPILLITGGVGCDGGYVSFSFDPNGWGTPPYIIRGEWGMANEWGFPVGSGVIGPYIVYGPFSWGAEVYPQGDAAGYGITFRVVDSEGRLAEKGAGWGFNCQPPPPPPGDGGTTTPPGPTTGTTTQPPAPTTYTITQTVTSTSFVYLEGPTTTVTLTATSYVWSSTSTTVYSTYTSTVFSTVTRVVWYRSVLSGPIPYPTTTSSAVYPESAPGRDIIYVVAGLSCPAVSVKTTKVPHSDVASIMSVFDGDTPRYSLLMLVMAAVVEASSLKPFNRKRWLTYLATPLLLSLIVVSLTPLTSIPKVGAEVFTTTTTSTVYTTVTLSSGTYTSYTYTTTTETLERTITFYYMVTTVTDTRTGTTTTWFEGQPWCQCSAFSACQVLCYIRIDGEG
ncbi:MAG: hypothetical protein QXD61_09670 [Candidatus Caldarchaeum sp.]